MDGLACRCPAFPSFQSPICTVAFRTKPSSSLQTSRTPSLHSLSTFLFENDNVSDLHICLEDCQCCLLVMFARYSFLHLLQNYSSCLLPLPPPGGSAGMAKFNVIYCYKVQRAKTQKIIEGQSRKTNKGKNSQKVREN